MGNKNVKKMLKQKVWGTEGQKKRIETIQGWIQGVCSIWSEKSYLFLHIVVYFTVYWLSFFLLFDLK